MPFSTADIRVLQTSPLLQGMTPEEVNRFSDYLTEQTFQKGQVIIWEKSAHRTMHLLVEGRAVVTKVVRGEVESVLATLEPGAHFGELTLIDGKPAAGNVTAELRCRVYSMDRDQLRRMLSNESPLFGKLSWALLRDLAGKLRDTNRKVQEAVAWGLDAASLDPAE
jgi:CRP-like cAMP-binding protein